VFFMVALCTSARAGDASTLVPGDLVGRLELAAPNVGQFVLRGTLPIPRGVYPRKDGKKPFLIRNLEGDRFITQVEIVSRYAGQSGDADVIELLSTVTLPEDVAAGEFVVYDVVYWPHDEFPFLTNPVVEELFENASDVVFRTRDVFGNLYNSRPLVNVTNGWRMRTLRDGSEAVQEMTHTTLLPRPIVQGPLGTLPHLMGVHTYFTRWRNEPFVTLDVRVHNAQSGLDPNNPIDDVLGTIYFKSLELRLPEDWTVLQSFDDPTFGAPYSETSSSGVEHNVWPLIAPLPNGKMHMMPSMSQLHRRYVIAYTGKERRGRRYLHEENLAFCRPGTAPNGRTLWSWWNPETARYFPQNHVLPDLDHVALNPMRDSLKGDLNTIAAMVAGEAPPEWPIISQRLGWAYPWGASHGGAAGGSEIYLYDGIETAWSSSNDGYRLAQLTHQMYSDRQRNMMFDGNGVPTTPERWVIEDPAGPFLPIWWYNGPILYATDPFGFGDSPSFQRDFVHATGLYPHYRYDLEGYIAIDEEHLIRYTRSPKVLVWLGNDALSRDDLQTQAEGIRFTYTDLPQDNDGATVPTGMLAARNYVDQYPHRGFSYGRAEGWGLDTMTAAYAILDPEWRAKTHNWFEKVALLVRDGQAECTGTIQSTPLYNVFKGQYRCRQSIECAIAENALWGMRGTVFDTAYPGYRDVVGSVLVNAAYSMVSPLVWNEEQHGPHTLFANGLFDNTIPPFCNWIPWNGNFGIIDSYQVWSSFAYGYELTGNPLFLNKAAELLREPLEPGLYDDGLDNLNNRAALIALMQAL
jgi:hypothetical protein